MKIQESLYPFNDDLSSFNTKFIRSNTHELIAAIDRDLRFMRLIKPTQRNFTSFLGLDSS